MRGSLYQTFTTKLIEMKTTNQFSVIIFLFVMYFVSCKKADQQGPGDNYCTSGQSVLTVNDDKVPSSLRNRIFSQGGVIHTAHPNYNKNGKVVIIPYSTPDFPINTSLTKQVIRDEFFTTGIGSANDFFQENSWGQFKLQEAEISETAVLPKAFTQYKLTESDPYFMQDVCLYSSINWPALDVNNDHSITPDEVQIVFIRSAGGLGVTRSPRNAFTVKDPVYKNLPDYITLTYFSGIQYNIYNNFVSIDCKKESDPSKATNTLSYNSSTLWHEMSHGLFNLVDRYTSYCGTGNTGQYDLMSDNCSRKHLNIYDKIRIGWIKPKISYSNATGSEPSGANVIGGTCLSFPAIESQPAALIRWVGTSPNEFWIFENRNKKSSPRDFESGLPDEGIAIWWVDMTSGEIHLIDANAAGQKPSTFKDQTTGALFKYPGKPVQSIYQALLVDKSGGAAFGIKSISPVGSNMYLSF